MLKKFVSSILAVILLAGCGSKPAAEDTAAANTADCAQMASALVEQLGLGDAVTEAKTRIVYGSFFNAREGDENLPVSDAAAYLPADKNSDTVAVFRTTDAEAVKKLLEDYLSAQKALSEMYSPDEVFKISNAIIETSKDNSLVALIVCNDIEDAKAKVSAVLGG